MDMLVTDKPVTTTATRRDYDAETQPRVNQVDVLHIVCRKVDRADRGDGGEKTQEERSVFPG